MTIYLQTVMYFFIYFLKMNEINENLWQHNSLLITQADKF